MENALYFGDNLKMLTGKDSQGQPYFPDASVDLVYLDPPFNSNRSYNVLFKDEHGDAPSQIRAFEDSWHWDAAAVATFNDFMYGDAAEDVKRTLEAFRHILRDSPMMAYLAMMTPRLIELHRVLKPTGSLYLHCDPTASHYLKIILDTVFGPENFRSEIVWQRTSAHSSAKRYGPVHDIILFYTKSNKFLWNQQYQALSGDYVDSHYRSRDKQGRAFTLSDLTGAGIRHGSSGQIWRSFDPNTKGRHWVTTIETLEEWDKEGKINWPAKGGWPRFIRYLDERSGLPMQDVWTDVPPINAQAAERLGYPTQKPVALLKRIIAASTNPGDVVLDPFCGCGTAIDAAHELGRHWRGIDLTHLAINLIKGRLHDRYGLVQRVDYRVIGEPQDIGGARALAEADKEQFEYWALGLVAAKPGEGKQRKGADGGIDGIIRFEDATGRPGKAIVSVKGGRNIGVDDVRVLNTVVGREGAQFGVLVSLAEPTAPMRKEAANADTYTAHSPLTLGIAGMGRPVRRIQLLTIEQLLAGARVEYPEGAVNRTFAQAPRAIAPPAATQLTLE